MCANSVTSFGVDWRWIDIIQLFPSLWKSIFFFYFSSLLKALFFLSSQPLYWLIMTEIVLNPTQWERKIPYTEKRKWNIFSFLVIVFIKALVCNERLKQQLFISCTIKHHQFVLLWAPYWCFKCLICSQEVLSQALPVALQRKWDTMFTRVKKEKLILNVIELFK